MPATLSAPGLYLQRAEPPRAIPGSAVTGFVGVSERGPINSPQPITGWIEYVDTFGGLIRYGHLAHAVFAFFRNGGEKCWVVRAADTSRIGVMAPAGECAQALPLATASALFVDHAGANTVRVSALDPGGWGNDVEVRVGTSALRPLRVATLSQATAVTTTRLRLDSVLDLRQGIPIRITDPDGFSNAASYEIDNVPTAVNSATSEVDLVAQVGRVHGIGSVVYAAGFRLEALFRGRRESFDPLSMRPGDKRYFADVINAPPGMADYGERRRRGFSSMIRVEHVLTGGVSQCRPADTTIRRTLAGGEDGFTQARATFRTSGGAPIVTIVAKENRGSTANGLEVVAIPFATRTALPIPDASGSVDHIVVEDARGFQPGEQVAIDVPASAAFETATPSAVFLDDMMLQLPADLTRAHAVGAPVAVADRFTLEVWHDREREPREEIHNLSGDAATSGSRFVRTALAAESRLLCANTPAAPFTTPIQAGNSEARVTFAGGADPGAMDARYYTGYQDTGAYFQPPELPAGTRVGLAALELVEEIGLVAVPDVTRLSADRVSAAQTSILRHCASLGDRFALLDAPGTGAPIGPSSDPAAAAVQATEEWSRSLGSSELRRYGAAFWPHVWATFDGADALSPASGAVAGLIARTDATLGVDKAPANELLKGVFALSPAIGRLHHGTLNELGVNCALKLEDGEVRLMGARTLSADATMRYINVRRTVLTVKKTLAQRMLWAVFEPLDEALFRRIEATLVTYLQALLARGATASQRAAESFYVRCNRDTNPAEQERLGIVVAEIGLALLAPAEFIVLTVRRTPDAIQVVEEDA